MCILEKWKLKKLIKKSYSEYLESLKKSEAAIENVSFPDGMTHLYFSNRNFEKFLETFSINPPNNFTTEDIQSNKNRITVKGQAGVKRIFEAGTEVTNSYSKNKKITENFRADSCIKTIKKNIESIKSDGFNIRDARENNFFYANFPVFHGRLIELNKEVPDVYLWYGEYGNIKLYLCGNIKNVSSIDENEFPSTKWDPSSIKGQRRIFQHLINDEGNKTFKRNDVFELFEDNIHKSVMNRRIDKSFYQWQEMIVDCTYIKEEDGIKKIIGIPLLVIPSKNFGYGWYNLKYKLRNSGKIKIDNNVNNKDAVFMLDGDKFKIDNNMNNKDAFFEFYNGEFTGRFLMKEKIYYSVLTDKIKLSDKIKVIDANSAYQHRYSVQKIQEKPSSEQVKKSTDIIGICIDKNLFAN